MPKLKNEIRRVKRRLDRIQKWTDIPLVFEEETIISDLCQAFPVDRDLELYRRATNLIDDIAYLKLKLIGEKQ